MTAHPVGPWLTQQARNLVATLEAQGRDFRYLVRDRDSKFVGPFDEVMRSVGAQVIKTPFRAPRANAFAERVVLTAPGRVPGLGAHPQRTPRRARTAVTRGPLQPSAPAPRHRPRAAGPDLAVPQFESGGTVERVDRLGGLLHEYRLAA